VITVLRLIGATDAYIEAAFVRRFAFRTFIGAVVGTVIGAGVVALFPGEEEQAAILTGLRLSGVEWMWLVLIPPILSSIAFSATRYAANRLLKGLT
jgi:cell division transport system permease protein